MPPDRYALLHSKRKVYLLTQSKVTTVTNDAPTLDAAIASLREAAPPESLKGVYVYDPDENLTFEQSQLVVDALRSKGYKQIEWIDVTAMLMTSCIYNLPIICDIGDVAFVLHESIERINVLEKCDDGWKIVMPNEHIVTAGENYPEVRTIVCHKTASKSAKSFMRQRFIGFPFHASVGVPSHLVLTFVQDRIDNGDFNGYRVLPYCRHNLLVRYGDTCDTIILTRYNPPFTITKTVCIDIDCTVEVRIDETRLNNWPLLKAFKFDCTKLPGVNVTVKVDETLLPQVTITETFFGRGVTSFSVFYKLGAFDVYKHVQKGQQDVSSCRLTISDVVAFIVKQTSPDLKTVVFFKFIETSTVVQMQTFRDECRKAGVLDVRFVPYYTVQHSIVLHYLQVQLDNGQSVALLYPDGYYIIIKDGNYLKIRSHGRLDVDEINSFTVKCVVIVSLSWPFEKAALDDLQTKLRSTNVHVVTDTEEVLSAGGELLQSFADETESNSYAFRDYADYDIVINSFQSYEVISTRFREVPFTTDTLLQVNGTTLEVSLLKSEKRMELLKTFTVPHDIYSVRVIICVESACDITVAMKAVDTKLDFFMTFLTRRDQGPEAAQANHDLRKAVAANIAAWAKPAGDSVASTSSKPKDVSQAKTGPTVTSEQPIEKPTSADLPVSMNADKGKVKKNRSQRKKQARRNAMKNAPSNDSTKPIDVLTTHNDKDNEIGSVPLPKELSQLQLDPPPTVILTFTTDNRVLIKADETYTGVNQLLAYVRLEAGKLPIVGQKAFDALKTHPDAVFYDITRLLADDFDPDYPHPSWRFKTTRDTDGKLLIHGGDNITTLPVVLFGLVVNSTHLYIKEHQKSEVTELGIRLPAGSVISDTDLKAVSERMCTKLVIVEDK